MSQIAKHVKAAMLDPMTAMFSPPFGTTDPATAMGEYSAALERFDQITLRKAWASIRQSWEGQNWPPVAKLVAEAERHRPVAGPVSESLASYTFRRAPEIAKAYESSHAGLYQRGDAEGWGMDLRCAVEDASRMVAQAEYLGSLKRKYPNIERDPYRIVVTSAEAEVWRNRVACRPEGTGIGRRTVASARSNMPIADTERGATDESQKIGRASCRERV